MGSEPLEDPAVTRRVETIAVLIISLTAILAAWTTFQSAKWSGLQDLALAEAEQTLQLASSIYADAREEYIVDVLLYQQWFEATIRGEDELAETLEDFFTVSLAEAFDPWIALDPLNDPDAPGSPFDEFESPIELEADDLVEEAGGLTADAREYNQQSDDYTAVAILLATVILFAALSDKVPGRRAQRLMLGLSAVGLVAGFAIVATFPVEV